MQCNGKVCRDGWVRCGNCNHKLGKATGDWTAMQSGACLEVKCHSCKQIVKISIGTSKTC